MRAQQQDAQELLRVLFAALDASLKKQQRAPGPTFIGELYEGEFRDCIKCKECGTERERSDK